MAISSAELAERIRNKPTGQPPDFLNIQEHGEVTIGGRSFRLRDLREARLEDDGFDSDPGDGRMMAARAVAPHWGGIARPSSPIATQAKVSHCNLQTPLRDQLDRPTCLSFASVACIESLVKVKTGTVIDLSEQLCNYILEGNDNCSNSLLTKDAPAKLGTQGLCEEKFAPYEDSEKVTHHCEIAPFNVANSNGSTILYGIDQYHVIERAGLDGPSIINTDYLEYMLEQGHDIVLDLRLAGEGMTKVLDVILDPATGEPLRSFHSHVVLAVGYDRTADPQYFLCKSSTGSYWKISYDYVRVYARAGFIVEMITVNAPPAELRLHEQSCMALA